MDGTWAFYPSPWPPPGPPRNSTFKAVSYKEVISLAQENIIKVLQASFGFACTPFASFGFLPFPLASFGFHGFLWLLCASSLSLLSTASLWPPLAFYGFPSLLRSFVASIGFLLLPLAALDSYGFYGFLCFHLLPMTSPQAIEPIGSHRESLAVS